MSTILHDPREPLRHQPREDGPTYLLRVGRKVDVPAWEREKARCGARSFGVIDLAALTVSGAKAMLDEADREAALSALNPYIDVMRDALRQWSADRTDDNWQGVVEAMEEPGEVTFWRSRIAREYEPLMLAMADNAAAPFARGIAGCRFALTGWEGIDEPFVANGRGASDASIDLIDDGDIRSIGEAVDGLFRLDEARAKKLRIGVFWRLRPDEFAGAEDEDLEDGEYFDLVWLGCGELTRHPSKVLDTEDRVLLDAWLAYRGDGMGRGHLPFAGGSMEQPAVVAEALETMLAAESLVREKFRKN